MNESLAKILDNLLSMRSKRVDAPFSSEQHWCDAINELVKLNPDYSPINPEFQYELKYVELTQALLHGEISEEDADHIAKCWGIILDV